MDGEDDPASMAFLTGPLTGLTRSDVIGICRTPSTLSTPQTSRQNSQTWPLSKRDDFHGRQISELLHGLFTADAACQTVAMTRPVPKSIGRNRFKALSQAGFLVPKKLKAR